MRVEFIGIRTTGPDPVDSAVVPIATGAVTALYGMNGAGKSRVLAGIDATVRSVRPPREEDSSGSLVFEFISEDGTKQDSTYTRPLADRAAQELRRLHQLLGSERGIRRSTPEDLASVLRDLVLFVLLEAPDHPDVPADAAEVAELASAARTAAVRVVHNADDQVDPGDPRPLSFTPAIPTSAAEALKRIDIEHEAVDADAVTNLQLRIAKSASNVPVPLEPHLVHTVTLEADELGLLPPVVRLYDRNFAAPTLAVLYGVPTLREKVGSAHRGLIDIADTDTFSLTADVAASAQRLQDEANRIYRRLLQDAPPLRLRIRHPNDWARTEALQWEAEVSAAPPQSLPEPGASDLEGRWLPIELLSTGQGRWASFAIRVACLLADPADGPYGAMVILDEPEQALHRQAERYCAEGLRQLATELGLLVIVATHSPEVLDARDALPLHVTRDAAARTRVRAFPGWLTSDETTLGLARSDLVLRYRTFLLVEGAHDEAALRVWAGDDLEEARTQILVLGGANHLAPVVASQLLFDMTDAHVVVMLDGVDGASFLETWKMILADWHGQARDRARDRLDSFSKQGGEIGLLADFCRQSLQRGHEHRIHPFGLTEPDISNYFPVDTFAPGRPETWQRLRDDARASLGRDFTGAAFKNWLQVHRGVNISVATIERAATRTQRPPEVDDLIELCRRTSRLRAAR